MLALRAARSPGLNGDRQFIQLYPVVIDGCFRAHPMLLRTIDRQVGTSPSVDCPLVGAEARGTVLGVLPLPWVARVAPRSLHGHLLPCARGGDVPPDGVRPQPCCMKPQ